jgi:hypothetical protein
MSTNDWNILMKPSTPSTCTHKYVSQKGCVDCGSTGSFPSNDKVQQQRVNEVLSKFRRESPATKSAIDWNSLLPDDSTLNTLTIQDRLKTMAKQTLDKLQSLKPSAIDQLRQKSKEGWTNQRTKAMIFESIIELSDQLDALNSVWEALTSYIQSSAELAKKHSERLNEMEEKLTILFNAIANEDKDIKDQSTELEGKLEMLFNWHKEFNTNQSLRNKATTDRLNDLELTEDRLNELERAQASMFRWQTNISHKFTLCRDCGEPADANGDCQQMAEKIKASVERASKEIARDIPCTNCDCDGHVFNNCGVLTCDGCQWEFELVFAGEGGTK